MRNKNYACQVNRDQSQKLTNESMLRGAKTYKRKKGDKDQESMQSSTTICINYLKEFCCHGTQWILVDCYQILVQ